MKNIDLIGKKYNRFTIIEDKGIIDKNRMVLVECICGNKKEHKLTRIKSGCVKSCGCLSVETRNTHGLRSHTLYTVWNCMIQRCTNPKNTAYKNYGGRGIKVCEEWLNSFEKFYDWAINNGWADGLHLDKDIKKPNNSIGIYCPEYCCFVTRKQNQRNRRGNVFIEYNGKIKCLKEWAEYLGINYRVLRARIDREWTIERAFKNENFKYNQLKKAS